MKPLMFVVLVHGGGPEIWLNATQVIVLFIHGNGVVGRPGGSAAVLAFMTVQSEAKSGGLAVSTLNSG